jgi:hypothetical protein
MYQLRKNNVKQENRTLLDSSQKPKSPTVYSNKETFNASRSFTNPDIKEKKKVPKPKPHK